METVSLVVSILSLAAFLWVSWILWKDSKRSVKVSYKRLRTKVGLENGGVLAPPKGKLVVELLSKKKSLGLGFVRFDAGGDLAGQRIVFDYRKSFQIQGAKFLLPPHPDNTANKRKRFELVVVPSRSVLCVLKEIREWIEEFTAGEQKIWGTIAPDICLAELRRPLGRRN